MCVEFNELSWRNDNDGRDLLNVSNEGERFPRNCLSNYYRVGHVSYGNGEVSRDRNGLNNNCNGFLRDIFLPATVVEPLCYADGISETALRLLEQGTGSHWNETYRGNCRRPREIARKTWAIVTQWWVENSTRPISETAFRPEFIPSSPITSSR